MKLFDLMNRLEELRLELYSRDLDTNVDIFIQDDHGINPLTCHLETYYYESVSHPEESRDVVLLKLW
jgi:hypothetical protein